MWKHRYLDKGEVNNVFFPFLRFGSLGEGRDGSPFFCVLFSVLSDVQPSLYRGSHRLVEGLSDSGVTKYFYLTDTHELCPPNTVGLRSREKKVRLFLQFRRTRAPTPEGGRGPGGEGRGRGGETCPRITIIDHK